MIADGRNANPSQQGRQRVHVLSRGRINDGGAIGLAQQTQEGTIFFSLILHLEYSPGEIPAVEAGDERLRGPKAELPLDIVAYSWRGRRRQRDDRRVAEHGSDGADAQVRGPKVMTPL